MNSESWRQLMTVKKTQLEMLRDRGYDISREEPLFEWGITQFKSFYEPIMIQNKYPDIRKLLDGIYIATDESLSSPPPLLVKYLKGDGSSPLGIEIIRSLVLEIQGTMAPDTNTPITNCMVIGYKKINSNGLTEIGKLKSYSIRVWREEELIYNPTKHYLVSQHAPLTENEAKKFLQNHKINISQLPRILTTDIIMRYYDLGPGNIIKVVHDNLAVQMMVNKSISYLVVTEGDAKFDEEGGEEGEGGSGSSTEKKE